MTRQASTRRAHATRRTNRRPLRPRNWAAPPPRRLAPDDELKVVLHTIDDFGRSIQNADTKAGALTAVLSLVVGGLMTEAPGVRAAMVVAARPRGAPGIAFVVFLLGFAAAGIALGLTQVPRLATSTAARRLAFPSMARMGHRGCGTGDAAALHDEAWLQAETLAIIAMRKFRWLRLAVPATGICVAAFLSWLITSVPG
jgi:hypothetical protein